MRIGLLGPSDGDLVALAKASSTAVDRLGAQQVIYLGADGALDRVVAAWAEGLGVDLPIDQRPEEVRALLDADLPTLRSALDHEHARRRFGVFRALGGPGLRALEILNDRVVVMVDDKSVLDEEDLLPATVIVFGRGDATIRRVGTRVFIAPGHPTRGNEGICLLDEGEGNVGISVTLHDVGGATKQKDFIETSRSAKLKVHA